MDLGELLTPEQIKLNLAGSTKFEVIEELLDVLMKAGKVGNRQQALDDLLERERYLSTGLEKGLAVPHAKTGVVTELTMAFGISRQGVEFDSLDGKPAHFIFLVLSPRDTSGPHIKALAQITRLFREGEMPERLLQAESPEAILELLEQ